MSSDEEVKRQLYNRQEYVVGQETQRKYGQTDVLIVGLSGLGCEVAKNILLTGVRSVTLADDSPVAWEDLSSMFYAAEADVGKPRAAALATRLAELNRFVHLRVHKGAVDEQLVAQHHVVVFVDNLTTRLTKENEWARRHNVKFVACESRGVTGCVFVDAGAEFVVNDTNGEETVSCIVTAVTPDGDILCHDDKKHECVEGDKVFFTSLDGVAALNSPSTTQPNLFKVVSVTNPFVLRVAGPPGTFPALPQKLSGYMHTTKQPVTMKFAPLAEALKNPSFAFVDDDEAKFTAPSLLHTLFQAAHAVAAEHGGISMPAVTAAAAIDAIVAGALALDKDVDVKLVRSFAETMRGNLNPMACFIGGLASQEVLKCSSGKFTPLQQWLYYDAREVLGARGDVSAAERAPRGTRYDGQIAVLGNALQNKILAQSGFIVGSGALGCELIKNFACVGFGCGAGSRVHITDMDTIELSNLSRQFLFRTRHIGKMKSRCAAEAAKEINHALNVVPLELKVGPETENVFNEDFWIAQGVVCNALDNVQARRYVDQQCVFFKRPLFESGTLGTKCNAQSIIPLLTESYSSSYDPPEKTIPLCTLKNFPNSIEHTIQWAREMFEKFFTSAANDINGYLHDAGFMESLNADPGNKPAVFANLIEGIGSRPHSYADCVMWSRRKFEDLFVINIKQLLHNLPLDKVDEHGQPFWSGAKKPPTPLTFDAGDAAHMAFVVSAANLYAAVYSIPRDDKADVAALASSAAVPTFQPAVVKFALKENEQQQAAADLGAANTVDESRLPPRQPHASLRAVPAEFEKDDDSNFHMDFITAVSNLRAMNYTIPTEDKTRTKMIAGKIIPAMVTTTALVTGLVMFETLKFVMGCESLEAYKSSFVNIALPLVTFTTPIAPKKVTHVLADGTTRYYTMWDRFDVDEGRDVTLKELVEIIRTRFKVDPSMMSTVEGKLIFSSFGMKAERLGMRVSQVVEEISKTTLDAQLKHLSFVITPDEEVDVPLLRYKFR